MRGLKNAEKKKTSTGRFSFLQYFGWICFYNNELLKYKLSHTFIEQKPYIEENKFGKKLNITETPRTIINIILQMIKVNINQAPTIQSFVVVWGWIFKERNLQFYFVVCSCVMRSNKKKQEYFLT